jgi:hypothetical protein
VTPKGVIVNASQGPTGPPANGVTQTFTVPLDKPRVSDVPSPDTLTPGLNGGIVVTTSRSAGHPAHLAWDLVPDGLPSGAVVEWVDVRVCGHGTGDFYEVYGPNGADPVEYEVTAPQADGCWHFAGPTTDYNVTIYAYGDTTMAVDRIEMTLTTDR